jgi:Ribosomal protein S7e
MARKFKGSQTLGDCAKIPLTFSVKSPAHFAIFAFERLDNRQSTTANMSSPQLNKIAANSPSRQNPSELETSIAGALYDLETNTADLKAALRPLQFVNAREV